MASDGDDDEEYGYFYDDDDAEEDAAAGLEQAAAPPPERRADYWVSGYRSSPASTNARSPRRRDRGGPRRSGSALHLRTPIRQILSLAHRKGKVKRQKEGGQFIAPLILHRQPVLLTICAVRAASCANSGESG